MSGKVKTVAEEGAKRKVRRNEIFEKRGENRKTFRMDGSTEQAVFYPTAIHVLDEKNGRYEKVDHTLVAEIDGSYFHNRKGNFTAKFSCQESTEELFSVEKGKHRITVSAKMGKGNKGVLPKMIDGSNRLLFEEIMAGTDMECTVMGGGVKGNILIKEGTKRYRYSFLVHCENVSVQFDPTEKSMLFLSNQTGETVFYIPGPFMQDAAGHISTDVVFHVKKLLNGDILFVVTADSAWINTEERVFPITINMHIMMSDNHMQTYSWHNGTMYTAPVHTIGSDGSDDTKVRRMYMRFDMPMLPRNPHIKEIILTVTQESSAIGDDCSPKLGLYQVIENIHTGVCTPEYNTDRLIDYQTMERGNGITYSFDITSLIDIVRENGETHVDLVLKKILENNYFDNKINIYGSENNGHSPQIHITYEPMLGVNTSSHVHTHELGILGQGSVDLQSGNLMFESEDFVWDGSRMPVTIKHLYNSAIADCPYTEDHFSGLKIADYSDMKLGHGWKLNLMQSMKFTPFVYRDILYSTGYVFTEENGKEIYFKQSDLFVCCEDSINGYYLYEDIDGNNMWYDPDLHTLVKDEEIYSFDTKGRLICITDAYGNEQNITYISDQIASVTDGADREFTFTYNKAGFLACITAPDGTCISYNYTDNMLTGISYPTGRAAVISYACKKPTSVTLKNADGKDIYKVEYAFQGDCIQQVSEYGIENDSFIRGISWKYSYSSAARRTIVKTTEPMDREMGETKDTVIKTVYTFDDKGDVMNTYTYTTDVDSIQKNCITPYAERNGTILIGNNTNNLAMNHRFENLNNWNRMPYNDENIHTIILSEEGSAKFGNTLLRMETQSADCKKYGVYQISDILSAGVYTFSIYLRAMTTFAENNAGGYIRVTDMYDHILAESEKLFKYNDEYVRLAIPFELHSTQQVKIQILLDGEGVIYADAAQLEKNPFATPYNMLKNGAFEHDTDGWQAAAPIYSENNGFNRSKSLAINGCYESSRFIWQIVPVKMSQYRREAFILSGWAKGCQISDRTHPDETAPKFQLRALITYMDGTTESYIAAFSPYAEEWQFSTVKFEKSAFKRIKELRVYCEYNYNAGTAYFDNIQLVRDHIEIALTENDFSIHEFEKTATNKATISPKFEEALDMFGNVRTKTTFAEGEYGTIYCSSEFEINGNDLICETDARGNHTTYIVDEKTSHNMQINDRCGNKTCYTYDDAGRIRKITTKGRKDNVLAEIIYGYDPFDNITEAIRSDGTKYILTYNAFHNLHSIGIEGISKDLIIYTYKKGTDKLKQIIYANGDTVKMSYNLTGQLSAEKWYDKDGVLTAYYKYVYDMQGTIVRLTDVIAQKEYVYLYEDGHIVRAAEYNLTLNDNGSIIDKVMTHSIIYSYNPSNGQLSQKQIISANREEQSIIYEYLQLKKEDNASITARFDINGRTITTMTQSDILGRKIFDELQLGTGYVSRQFYYHVGEITDEHIENEKQQTTPTTQIISHIIFSNHRTITYEYDKEDRIIKITDSMDGVTEYTYDELGQLLTEVHNGVTVNKTDYDSYGNIQSKNSVEYTYNQDGTRNDLLIRVGNCSILYDIQGNPTNYFGHDLTWEKGRQLKSFDNYTYMYNANGIRTGKIIDGIKHEYFLDGNKILRETWGENSLIPLYDVEGCVCGISYNGASYYFQKDLQGDIIAIIDADAKLAAKYTYDAWGNCTVVEDITSCGIAYINPYRYRGYYYDAEIGMYYVLSRYYDPNIGRFLNGDITVVPFLKSEKTSCNSPYTYNAYQY